MPYNFKGMKTSHPAETTQDAPYAAPLAVEIWDIHSIASFLRVKVPASRGYLNQPGFPAPLANKTRNRRWLASEVRAYLLRPCRGTQQIEPASYTYEPASIRMKSRGEK